MTKVQHQDGTYTQSGYNDDGTPAWTADENHPGAATDVNQRVRYTYDEYKRVLTVTNPMGETTTNYYGLDWANPLVHTTNCVKYTVSPMNKNVVFDYDENLRKKYQTVAANTLDIATTFFDYDEVGNLTLVRDPRQNVTTFGYDNRNRKIWMDDPIASDRNSSGHTMNWEYDAANNKKKETRADGALRSWDYDSMNRLWHAYEWRTNQTPTADQTTTYTRDAQDLTESITDPKLAVYTFTFDALHRKTSETYPPDAFTVSRTETWLYDPAGNIHQHVNRSGAAQNFAPYDNRNRPTSFTWSDGTQGQSFEYDPASRVTAIHNTEADIGFGYDAANRKTSETETVKSYGVNQTHTVTYEYNPDGNRSRLVYPHVYDYHYNYTNRNQLANIQLAWASSPTIQYTYDAAGNRARRTNYFGAYTEYDFNEVNLLRSQTSHFAGNQTARFDYGYDTDNRMKYEQRDSGVADGYGFDVRGELTAFNNSGTLNQNGSVNAAYNVSISYDANGNRIEAYDGNHAPYATAASNQYTSDWTGGLGYDYNANLTSRQGWNFTYDAQNRLVSIDNNGTGIHIHQHYDALNRIVARDVNGDVTVNVWDNWDLLEECYAYNADAIRRCYLHGAAPNEIVASFDGPNYGDAFYFQDGRGNTTHLLDDSNNVIEHYTYFVSGQPNYFNGGNVPLGGSLVDNRFLFEGALFVPQAEIYDMRNRFYHPNLGRFMQSDPTGFDAGDMNLFRYCGNDPVDRSDPMGLVSVTASLWNDLMWAQGGSLLSSAVGAELKQLHADGWVTTGHIEITMFGKPGESKGFAGFVKAAEAIASKVLAETTARHQEHFSRIEKNGSSDERYTGPVRPGNGIKAYADGYDQGRADTSTFDNANLHGKGWRVEGFVLGHQFYDRDKIDFDMSRLRDKGWYGYFITPAVPGSIKPSLRKVQEIAFDYNEPNPNLPTP